MTNYTHNTNKWFTSDLHFFHNAILGFCNRPWASVEEMNEGLIERWNRVVKPQDDVWSLGDFSFGKIDQTIEIMKRLNGNIRLVHGNHDQQMRNHASSLLKEGLIKEHHEYKEIKISNKTICLFHYRIMGHNKCHYGSWHLHGHHHSKLPPYGKSVDVGIDSQWILPEIPYRPFHYEEIKAVLDQQPILEHH